MIIRPWESSVNSNPVKPVARGEPVPIKRDKGLGDTLERVIKITRLDKVAEAYTAITGKPCNCQQRKELLNKLVPY